MNETSTETLSVIVEREVPYPPEKIWRALTQPPLIEEWLMKNDFKPVEGHRFNLRSDPHADEHGDPPAHGAVGLPAGSAAERPGRPIRMAEVLCKSGAGPGADRFVDAASTIKLMIALLASYPRKRVSHSFLDNARYHHAKLLQTWLARPGCRIKLHCIPTDSAHPWSASGVSGVYQRPSSYGFPARSV
ncbi:MAG TPA: SRPBCC domain-containing protein [Acetobacteraceae bacterium]|nr:SRPBCC domain-containing protein [Acetobacteraceae bacterium]